MQELGDSTSSINGGLSTIPIIATRGSASTLACRFKISVKMYGDSGGPDATGQTTSESQTNSPTTWRGYTVGLV